MKAMDSSSNIRLIPSPQGKQAFRRSVRVPSRSEANNATSAAVNLGTEILLRCAHFSVTTCDTETRLSANLHTSFPRYPMFFPVLFLKRLCALCLENDEVILVTRIVKPMCWLPEQGNILCFIEFLISQSI